MQIFSFDNLNQNSGFFFKSDKEKVEKTVQDSCITL